MLFFFFSSRRRHTRWNCDWSSDVCSSDLRNRLAVADIREHAGEDREPGLGSDRRHDAALRHEAQQPHGLVEHRLAAGIRSEERRVGKECSSRGASYAYKYYYNRKQIHKII